jgi:Na+-translocating ferredoxin:NAD+ oxidoreductase subunit C
MSSANARFKVGGVHPHEGKELSASSALVTVEVPKRIQVPVSQHLGKPGQVVVKKGEDVQVGQLLATADGPISAPLHSPVSGKVLKVADGEIVGAYRAPIIDIMNNGKFEGEESISGTPIVNWDEKAEFLERIRDAGVVGLGGAAFPTAVKLSPPPNVSVDHLLINGCECEPYLTADDILMREHAAEVVAGCAIMAGIIGVDRVRIGVEDNKPGAIEALSTAISQKAYAATFQGEEPSLDIAAVPLRTMYPQGAEKQLIEAITGRQVPSGQLPFSVGCVVQNVGTALAVFDAVAKKRPLIERVVTLTGGAITNPGNYLARIGTPVSALVAAAGGVTEALAAQIAGGPMMGKSLRNHDVPVVKGMSGLLFLTEAEAAAAEETDCIRCGRCVHACPMGLAPCDITAQADFQEWEKSIALGAMDCVECGSCQYVCPASRFLVARVRLTKFYSRRLKK